jgi:hypothetical protein
MRHLMLIRVDAKDYEAGMRPPQPLVEAMGPLLGEWAKKGVLLAADGLRPTSEGKRLRIGGGKLSVSDGPFTEAKEVIGGFFLLQTDTVDEALALTREFVQLHADVCGPSFVLECELRRIDEPPAGET